MKSTIIIIILLIVTIIGTQTQTLFPTTNFNVAHTNGILNYIQIPENSNEFSGRSCRLQIPAIPEAITIDLNEYLLEPYKLKSGEKIKKFSNDLCGVRMYPISKTLDASKMDLIMEYNNGTSVHISFIINVLNKIENLSPINISYSFTGVYSISFDHHYHEYEDEFGERFELTEIYFNRKYNSDKWISRGLWRYQLDEIKTVINLIDDSETISNKFTILTTTETAESYIFQCNLTKYTSYSGICYARKPDGSMIHIGSGYTSDNYSTYDTLTTAGLCSIEILKPCNEIDKGIWRIIFERNPYSGCIFSLEDEYEKKKQIDDIESTANFPIQLDVDVTPSNTDKIVTIIKCEYPEEIEYCILENPNGGIEEADSLVIDRTWVLGYCSYSVYPIPGKWVCNIKTYESDIFKTIHYQMNTYNGSYIAANRMSEKKFITESIVLMCQSRFKYKLQYCIFESPDGIWYNLSEKNRNKITRISYAGRGLRYGECGIEIANIRQEDFGYWTCHVKVDVPNAQYKHQSLKIILIEDEMVGSAVILGVSIAVGIILLALIARFTYTRYRTRRNNNLNNSDIEFE